MPRIANPSSGPMLSFRTCSRLLESEPTEVADQCRPGEAKSVRVCWLCGVSTSTPAPQPHLFCITPRRWSSTEMVPLRRSKGYALGVIAFADAWSSLLHGIRIRWCTPPLDQRMALMAVHSHHHFLPFCLDRGIIQYCLTHALPRLS